MEHLKRALHEDVLFAKGSQNAELLRHIVDNIMLCLESFNLGKHLVEMTLLNRLQFSVLNMMHF